MQSRGIWFTRGFTAGLCNVLLCLSGTGTIVSLPRANELILKNMGDIDNYQTTKHDKA